MSGTTVTWIDQDDGATADWDTASDWSSGTSPNSPTLNVAIEYDPTAAQTPFVNIIIQPSDTISVDNLTIGLDPQNTATLYVEGSLSVAGTLDVGEYGIVDLTGSITGNIDIAAPTVADSYGGYVLGLGEITGSIEDDAELSVGSLAQAGAGAGGFVSGDLRVNGAITGDGVIAFLYDNTAPQAGSLEVGAVAAGLTVDFSTASKTVILDDIADFKATIVDFNQNEDYDGNAIVDDQLVIKGLSASATSAHAVAAATGLTIDYVQTTADAGELEFRDGSGATLASLNFDGTYTTADFTLTESDGEYIVGSPPVCYAPGTMIATPAGERPIEELREGDLVSLFDGGTAPVVWIGRRRVRCDDHPHPETVCPVRIRAGAFGAGLPRRDLVLSPQHAVFHDGALFPVNTLINGRSVVQEPATFQVYLHVELPLHAVLIANGLPAESYLDTGNRQMFANAALAPRTIDADPAEPCAPLQVEGPSLQALRRHLQDLATASQPTQCAALPRTAQTN